MEYFDAYEEVYSAIERFAEHEGKAPESVSVSPTLYRWLTTMKQESVLLNPEEPLDSGTISTRFGHIPLVIDEMLTPYEILVE